MLVLAIILITAALIFYTTGVWTEHRAGVLHRRHAILFACGLALDASGTSIMGRIAARSSGPTGLLTQIMQVTGGIALVLMAFHLAWALIVLIRNRSNEKAVFHRLSLVVWGIWLVPYITGMLGSAL